MNFPASKTTSLITFLFVVLITCSTNILAQKETEPLATHYVFPTFVKGTVIMKDGKIEEAMMDYNKVSEEMIFESNGVKLALDRLETIDTVFFESRKFIPYGKVFYEVVIKAHVSLFVQHKVNLLFAGKPGGYGGTSETGAATSVTQLSGAGGTYHLKLPSEYHVTNASLYWIRRDNKYYRANSNHQFLKIFPEKSKEINQFIKQKHIDIKNLKDLMVLINTCNELYR